MGIWDHSIVLNLLNLSRPPSGLRSPCSCPPPHGQVALVRTKAWEQWNKCDLVLEGWRSTLQCKRQNASARCARQSRATGFKSSSVFLSTQWLRNNWTLFFSASVVLHVNVCPWILSFCFRPPSEATYCWSEYFMNAMRSIIQAHGVANASLLRWSQSYKKLWFKVRSSPWLVNGYRTAWQ